MNRTYKNNNINSNDIMKYILIIGIAVFLLLILIWILPNSDRSNYRSYKAYESKINKQLNDVITSTNTSSSLYYKNGITKKQMVSKLKDAAHKLTKLYDGFKWKRGDSNTKELYIIKKQIIINYAQIYEYKAKSIEKAMPSTETQELTFIDILEKRYLEIDRYEKERFRLAF